MKKLQNMDVKYVMDPFTQKEVKGGQRQAGCNCTVIIDYIKLVADSLIIIIR